MSEKIYNVPAEWAARAYLDNEKYQAWYKRSLEDFAPLARKLASHVLQRLGLSLDAVVPVTRIPRTTSGKVQRFALRQRLSDPV